MFSQTILVGNLGSDPELKYYGQTDEQGNIIPGTEYARTTFSLATNRVWTDKAGVKMQKTVWFRVTCWRRVAETVSAYLTKGRQVLVIGEVEEASAWVDNENNLRATNEITARTVKFLGGGRQSATEAEAIVEAFTGETLEEEAPPEVEPVPVTPQPAPRRQPQPVPAQNKAAPKPVANKPQQFRTSTTKPVGAHQVAPAAAAVAIAEEIPF